MAKLRAETSEAAVWSTRALCAMADLATVTADEPEVAASLIDWVAS